MAVGSLPAAGRRALTADGLFPVAAQLVEGQHAEEQLVEEQLAGGRLWVLPAALPLRAAARKGARTVAALRGGRSGTAQSLCLRIGGWRLRKLQV